MFQAGHTIELELLPDRGTAQERQLFREAQTQHLPQVQRDEHGQPGILAHNPFGPRCGVHVDILRRAWASDPAR